MIKVFNLIKKITIFFIFFNITLLNYSFAESNSNKWKKVFYEGTSYPVVYTSKDQEVEKYKKIFNKVKECKTYECTFSLRLEMYEISKSNLFFDFFNDVKRLGQHYRGGYGTKKNLKKFFEINEDALNIIDNNIPTYNNNEKTKKITENLNKKKSIISCRIGWIYYVEGNDYNKAFKYINIAANLKQPECLNNLGVYYSEGKATKINHKKAFELYSEAASLGVYYAHNNIADYYIYGTKPVKKNYTKAITHLKLSKIEKFNLNFIKLEVLFKHQRLPTNNQELASWIESETVEKKNHFGFKELAFLEQDDNKNNKKAYKWYLLCSELSTVKWRCKNEMAKLNKILSKSDIKKITSMANNWKEKFWFK